MASRNMGRARAALMTGAALALATGARAQTAPATPNTTPRPAAPADGEATPDVKATVQSNGNPPSTPTPTDGDTAATGPDIVVNGIRGTLQQSIDVKRNETAIVDALSAQDIGDLPALSIGEAIETITGATTHREKGGATEIALRGLGSFLSNTTFNGREATNGSGDRAVNFNQFPSELVNGIKIYKSQQANLIEGGVAGTIELETLRPLDYGKRALQVEVKGSYSPYSDRLRGDKGLGSRATISYIDQYDLGGLGRVGIALGFQRNHVGSPEETVAGSSTWVACSTTPVPTNNCTEVTRQQGNAGRQFYLVPNSVAFRQIGGDQDLRNAFLGSVQWAPTSRVDVNLDFQLSRRFYVEDRHDLNFSETRYGLTNVQFDPDTHKLLFANGTSSIESTGDHYSRGERYIGGGGKVAWRATDRFTIGGDASYSETHRDTLERSVRLRTDDLNLDGVKTPVANQRIPYTYDARTSFATLFTVDPRFDVNDYNNFADDARLRRELERKSDQIYAGRIDGGYTLDGFFSRLDVGARYSFRHYQGFDDLKETTQDLRSVDKAVSLACRQPFPQTGFLSDAPQQSFTSFATFDTLCQFRQYLGSEDPGGNADTRSTNNADVREKVRAGYAMMSYKGDLGDLPIRGNFGVRVVDTRLDSRGLTSALNVVNNPDGTIRLLPAGGFTGVEIKNSYFRVLPSFNAVLELSPDVQARMAVYRGMSRPAPSDLAAGRDVALNTGTAFTEVEDAIANITADGSPRLKPIMSWNGDVALEWYPNRDTIVAGTVYYKKFNGGFIPVVTDETFLIGGIDATVPVTQRQNSADQSRIYGLEVTLANRFSWLPKPFDGLGGKLSYSFADSDFENEDIRLGDVVDPVSGTVTQGIIPPANLTGYSKHVVSAQAYYQKHGLSVQGIFNYRSRYYQDFVGGNTQLRYVEAPKTFDARVSYTINKHLSVRLEGLNLFNEPKVTYMPVIGSSRQYHYYGPIFFAGVRVRL